jgi:hypothetical protein
MIDFVKAFLDPDTARRALVVAATSIALSCRNDRPPAPRAGADSIPSVATHRPDTTRFGPQPFKPGFHEIGVIQISSMSADTIIRKSIVRGIGWVFPPSSQWPTDTTTDLVVKADTVVTAPVIAYVDFYPMSDGGWGQTYAVTENGLHGELSRLTHEDYGLVAADSARGNWVRTVYGYTSDGTARYGWIRLAPGKVEFTTHTTLNAVGSRRAQTQADAINRIPEEGAHRLTSSQHKRSRWISVWNCTSRRLCDLHILAE